MKGLPAPSAPKNISERSLPAPNPIFERTAGSFWHGIPRVAQYCMPPLGIVDAAAAYCLAWRWHSRLHDNPASHLAFYLVQFKLQFALTPCLSSSICRSRCTARMDFIFYRLLQRIACLLLVIVRRSLVYCCAWRWRLRLREEALPGLFYFIYRSRCIAKVDCVFHCVLDGIVCLLLCMKKLALFWLPALLCFALRCSALLGRKVPDSSVIVKTSCAVRNKIEKYLAVLCRLHVHVCVHKVVRVVRDFLLRAGSHCSCRPIGKKVPHSSVIVKD